jgi:hypothetical protein
LTNAFIHVPKSAGSTVIYALRRIYGPRLWVRSGRGWRTDLPSRRELAFGSEPELVAGHMGYGMLEDRGIEGRYFTVIREPVARVASVYRHIRGTPTDPFHEHARAVSLADFMADAPSPELHDGQASRLRPRSASSERVSERDLDVIKAAVEAGRLLVGVTDMIDESLLLLRDELSWPLPLYWSQNRTRRTRRDAEDLGDLEGVAAANALDAELYRFARHHVERATAQPEVRRELRYFGAANLAYRAAVAPKMAASSLRARLQRSRSRSLRRRPEI